MNLTLSLNPEVEKGLITRAKERGVSLDDYLRELIVKGAEIPAGHPEPVPNRDHQGAASYELGTTGAFSRQEIPTKQFDNLSDLLLNSPFAGADLDLERSRDYPRAVDLPS
jgi:hypothetical protein